MSAFISHADGRCPVAETGGWPSVARYLPLLGLMLLLLTVGCAGGGDEEAVGRTGQGAAIGAVVGGLTGAVLDRSPRRGAVLGAAAGAALGGGIGYYLDRQQGELEDALAEEEATRVAAVERVDGDRLLVTIDNEVSFDHDSTAIRPSFLPTVERVADVLARYENSRVLIVGHTDDMGDAAYNRRLSQARAEAVRNALATYGVDPDRMRAEGRGESEPRADNASPAGRHQNRRVEILITPVG